MTFLFYACYFSHRQDSFAVSFISIGPVSKELWLFLLLGRRRSGSFTGKMVDLAGYLFNHWANRDVLWNDGSWHIDSHYVKEISGNMEYFRVKCALKCWYQVNDSRHVKPPWQIVGPTNPSPVKDHRVNSPYNNQSSEWLQACLSRHGILMLCVT